MAEFYPDHDDLHGGEELADVLDRGGEPRIQVSALGTAVEEELVQGRSEANDGADDGSKERRVGELPCHFDNLLGLGAEAVEPVASLEVSSLLNAVGGFDGTFGEKGSPLVDETIWTALDVAVAVSVSCALIITLILLVLFSLVILWRILVTGLEKARSQCKGERVADHGVDQKVRLSTIQRIGRGVASYKYDIEDLGLLQ